jgi:Skp family chaperone for outer membrane proteins
VSLSIAAINGPSLLQANTQNLASQLQQSFKQLTNSLQSGNLATAQKAFSNIQAALQSSQSASSTASSTSHSTSSKPPVNAQSIQDDVGALRQALGSGDLRSALTAYTKLQNDLRLEEPPEAPDNSASAQGGSGTAAKTVLYA